MSEPDLVRQARAVAFDQPISPSIEFAPKRPPRYWTTARQGVPSPMLNPCWPTPDRIPAPAAKQYSPPQVYLYDKDLAVLIPPRPAGGQGQRKVS